MKNRVLYMTLGLGAVIALGYVGLQVKNGLEVRQSLLDLEEELCLDSRGLFAYFYQDGMLETDPERWDIAVECATYLNNVDDRLPYLEFILKARKDWDVSLLGSATLSSHDDMLVRAKEVKAEITASN